MTSTIGSGSAQGALEYLDFLAVKGHVTPGAITALKTAFRKVIETVAGEEWAKVEVRAITVDDYMIRFANMTHGKYNAKSLSDYRVRVNKVIGWYLEFLKTPGWTPNVKTRTYHKPAKAAAINEQLSSHDQESVRNSESMAGSDPATQPSLQTKPNLVAFPFPLADGTLATLYLPTSITANDAKRMARYIETLVLEEATS